MAQKIMLSLAVFFCWTFALKAEGKVRHVGISFHDRAEVLEKILTEYPQIEVVKSTNCLRPTRNWR